MRLTLVPVEGSPHQLPHPLRLHLGEGQYPSYHCTIRWSLAVEPSLHSAHKKVLRDNKTLISGLSVKDHLLCGQSPLCTKLGLELSPLLRMWEIFHLVFFSFVFSWCLALICLVAVIVKWSLCSFVHSFIYSLNNYVPAIIMCQPLDCAWTVQQWVSPRLSSSSVASSRWGEGDILSYALSS